MKQLLITIAAVMLVGCGPQPPDTSIHQAATEGNIEVVKQHLAAGTDVNVNDQGAYGGATPLHCAASWGRKEIVELLIANGADVNAEDDDGRAPLCLATASGHKEIVELLIAEGADVNAKDRTEWTSLHSAAFKVTTKGKEEIAELLIANGADVNAMDKDGETPLDWADPEVANLLRKHGGKTGAELKAEGKPAEPVAEAAQPEPPTAKTPLWKAAMFGEIEPAKQAIADGADVNAKGERGLTPLHFAVVAALDSGDNKVIELLIANGADVNAKDDSGLTPLDSVKRLSEAAALVKRLRELQGKTDDIPVADLLRKHGGKTGEELEAGN